jgi:hypothetical protein
LCRYASARKDAAERSRAAADAYRQRHPANVSASLPPTPWRPSSSAGAAAAAVAAAGDGNTHQSPAVRRRLHLSPSQGSVAAPHIGGGGNKSTAAEAKRQTRQRGGGGGGDPDKENVDQEGSDWGDGADDVTAADDDEDTDDEERHAMMMKMTSPFGGVHQHQDPDDSFIASPPGALLSSSPRSIEGIAVQLYGRLTAARALRRLAAYTQRLTKLRAEAPTHYARTALRRLRAACSRHAAAREAAAEASAAAAMDAAAAYFRTRLLRGCLRAAHRLAGVMQWRRERHLQLALMGFIEYARRRRSKNDLVAAAREHLDRARSPMAPFWRWRFVARRVDLVRRVFRAANAAWARHEGEHGLLTSPFEVYRSSLLRDVLGGWRKAARTRRGLGFRVQGLGFYGLGFRVESSLSIAYKRLFSQPLNL